MLRLSLRELRTYLARRRPTRPLALPTHCPPWTVAGLAAHLEAAFPRFADQLAKARAGNGDALFSPGQMPSENLRAVWDFRSDPCELPYGHVVISPG